jgi:hypothetical protein
MQKHNKKYNAPKKTRKYRSELCEDDMTFQDCELAILRNAVDESDKIKGEKIVNNDEVQKMLKIVEEFISRKKLVCYGGTAINNILPTYAQFYNRDVEVPDYDFYSPNALEDAKELADIYYKAGYIDVEAKSGVHMGTFKVFVNFIPLADITILNKEIYDAIHKESIVVGGIHYAPPDFLRMAVYLELSRPGGDVSRWEKVFKRLALLNEHYPLKTEKQCSTVDFQRKMSTNSEESERLYITTRDTFTDQGVLFFGGYATSLYSKYMPEQQQRLLKRVPDFDVLSEEPDKCSMILKENLKRAGFKKVTLIKHDAIGEIIPDHIEVKVEKETIAFIYTPIACHSYNKIKFGSKEVKIATIDTILTFYLSFLYTDMHYYNKDRLLCMAKFLFDVEQHNRLEQKGLLKRFSLDCFGKQHTLEDSRSEKAAKYKELSGKHGTKEYEMWFLKYVPHNNKNKNKSDDKTNVEEVIEEDKKQVKNKKKDRESSPLNKFFSRTTKKNRSNFLF